MSRAAFIDLPGRYPHVDPPRAAPADHERADVVLLVHDDKRAAAGLVEQGVDVLLPVLHAPADPDLAVGIQPDGPVEGLADIHAEIELVGPEPVFLPALHGGNLLLGWLATVSARGDTHITLPRGMPGGTSLSVVSRGPPSSGSNTPRAFWRGRDRRLSGGGRPAAPLGPSTRLGRSMTCIVENPTACR
jgi:hypothetical protein